MASKSLKLKALKSIIKGGGKSNFTLSALKRRGSTAEIFRNGKSKSKPLKNFIAKSFKKSDLIK